MYDAITTAIENNKCNYKLLHGKFKQTLLEDYIGNFETLGNLVHEKVITNEMAHNEFGYDLEKAWCNKDVQKIIAVDRKADKNISGANCFYIGC